MMIVQKIRRRSGRQYDAPQMNYEISTQLTMNGCTAFEEYEHRLLLHLINRMYKNAPAKFSWSNIQMTFKVNSSYKFRINGQILFGSII